MIAPLLEALREKDPGAYGAWKAMHDVYSIREGCAMSDAWVQAVLQDACQARGWSWRMQGFPEIDDDHPGQTCCTIMRRKGIIWYDHKTAYGASPAEALLAAYLEAIV